MGSLPLTELFFLGKRSDECMAQFVVIVKRIKIGLFKCGDIYVIDSPFLFNQWQTPAHLQNDSDLRAISSEIASDLGWCRPIALAFFICKD